LRLSKFGAKFTQDSQDDEVVEKGIAILTDEVRKATTYGEENRT